LQIASFYSSKHQALTESPTQLSKTGRNASITRFSTHTQQKAGQGRGTAQGRKKTLKMKKHTKNTYKEISTMSLEA
jgi:hypothetical protein